MKRYYTLFLSLSLFSLNVVAQDTPDDMSALMDSIMKVPTQNQYVSASFKNSKLINQQTIEIPGIHCLDFSIQHRFGDLNSTAYNAWGMDGPASIRLGLDYSLSGKLMMGVGRSSYEKMVDGTLKYKILRQTQEKSMPLSLVWVSKMFYNNERVQNLGGFNLYQHWVDRFSYSHELIVGRKFSEKFTLQIAPIYVHYNIVGNISDKNDVFAITSAARYKISKRFCLMGESAFTLNHYSNIKYYNSSGLGFELETGGHVFQMFFTNSVGMAENQFISHTTSAWTNWGIKLGFNISRIFSL